MSEKSKSLEIILQWKDYNVVSKFDNNPILSNNNIYSLKNL